MDLQEPCDIYDITIIEAGPTGLFGAFYPGMRRRRTQIIEALAGHPAGNSADRIQRN